MKEVAFRQYLESRNLAPNTVAQMIYALKRIERIYSIDLDQAFDQNGLAPLVADFSYSKADSQALRANPTRMDIDQEKLLTHLAWYRHKLRDYQRFRSGGEVAGDDATDSVVDDEAVGRTFALEQDLQAALRAHLNHLEPGLIVADGGQEARVEAGQIDILAKDARGIWVVIELKADVARPAALTQVLAYMACIASEKGGDVRGILVASEFDKRITHAAGILPNVSLKRYRFNFEFL